MKTLSSQLLFLLRNRPYFQTLNSFFGQQKIKMKSSRELLEERLDRLKKNSQVLIARMDNKIQAISNVKNDLTQQTDKLSKVQKDYQNVIHTMAERMLGFRIPKQSQKVFEEIRVDPAEKIPYAVKKMLQNKEVCILTGAGVSKKSGIPTFRGEDGLYSKKFQKDGKKLTPEEFLTLDTFQEQPELIWKWFDEFTNLLKEKKPCINHFLIDNICMKLLQKGIKVYLITTNIDGFHQQVNNSSYVIEEIHGNMRQYLCEKCFAKHKIKQTDRDKFVCKQCKYVKCRPYIMFFNETYGEIFAKNILDKKFPFVMCVGTSLQTGLSYKIVGSAEEVIEINPKCVIKTGKVHKFENDCTEVLEKIKDEIK